MLEGLNEMFERRAKGLCPGCGADVTNATFRDELSAKEFRISGLCQDCQDVVFAEPEE